MPRFYETTLSITNLHNLSISTHVNRSRILLKRVVGSDGRDVVRFLLYPHAMSELIESCYFEVAFDVYKNLFTADKKTSYK